MEPVVLKKPPIKEVELSLYFDKSCPTPYKQIENSMGVFMESLPVYQNIIKGNIQVTIPSNAKLNASNTGTDHVGMAFTNQKKDTSVLVQEDRFSFKVVKKNYTSFEEFIDNALHYFGPYSDKVNCHSINRISLRYLNFIEIPLPINDILEYFDLGITLPSDLGVGINQTMAKLNLVNPNSKATAEVSVIVQVPDTLKLYVWLDIITTKTFDQEPVIFGTTDFGRTLDELRQFKNDIFFKSINDKTYTLIEST